MKIAVVFYALSILIVIKTIQIPIFGKKNVFVTLHYHNKTYFLDSSLQKR